MHCVPGVGEADAQKVIPRPGPSADGVVLLRLGGSVRASSPVLLVVLLVGAGCLGASPRDAGAGTAGTDASGDDPVCHGTVNGIDLRTATIRELQAALDDGVVTSVELIEAYIERIRAFDDRDYGGVRLNGVRMVNPAAIDGAAARDAERAQGVVRGPMHGIPVLVKDNVGTTDMPTTAGSIALAENYVVKDAGVVTRLREAGAVILGKAELLEWANWGAPDNGSSMGGPQRNAYNFGSASASSSGSGVSGSMAYSAVALGSETSGSILGPTQANGLAGLKPSHGFASGYGVVPIGWYFDVVGPMGRSVEDLAITFGAMAGSDPDDPKSVEADANLPPGGDFTLQLTSDALEGVRLGYDEEDSNPLFLDALADLESLGAVIVPIGDNDLRNDVGFTEWVALPNEFHFEINLYLQTMADPRLPFKTWHELMLWMGENHPEAHGRAGASGLALASAATPGLGPLADAQAIAAITASRAAADSIFEEHEVAAIVSAGSDFTLVGAAAGYPTVMVPMGYQAEYPRGLAFFGQRFSEPELLSYAYAYEQATQHRVVPEEFNPRLVEGLCDDVDAVPAAKPAASPVMERLSNPPPAATLA